MAWSPLIISFQGLVLCSIPPLIIKSNNCLQIFWDAFTARYGHGRGCLPLLYLPVVGQVCLAMITHMTGGRYAPFFSCCIIVCQSSG